jgi:LytS/YehU family sensor histidine kinase
VEARVEGRTLRVFVRDDGVGPSAGATGAARAPGADGAGIGLRNTRLRIKQMYGAAATLELRPRVPEGTEVAVSFPLSIERDGVIEGRGGLSWAARVR